MITFRNPAVLALAAALLASGCAAIDPYNMMGRRSTGSATALSDTPVPEPVSPGLSRRERERAFDFVWNTINERYYDPKLNGVDWKGVGARYRPQVLEAKDDDAFWDLLDRMTGELRDAHTRVESPKRARQIENNETVSLGFSLVAIGGDLVVMGVSFDSDAYWAGVRSGMKVVSIEGEGSEAAFERLKGATRRDSTERSRFMRATRRLTAGAPDSQVAFTFERSDGTRFDAKLKRRPASTAVSSTARLLPSGYAYIRLTQWTLGGANRMIAAIREHKAAPGMIIDLRGNGGGSLHAVKNALQELFPGKTELGRTLTRSGRPISLFFETVEVIAPKLSVNGGPEAYTGALVVLVNEGSASGSEYFAGAIQAAGRGLIVGQPTCGCLLGFLGYAAIPGGGELAYSEVGFEMADGKRVEGVGVIPDVAVALTLADLQLNRDRALEEAQAKLATMKPYRKDDAKKDIVTR